MRRRVAEAAAASRSYDEALFELSRHTGAEVPKRQAEQLVARAAEDFDAFYGARRAAEGEPPPEGSVVVLTFDGKGVVLHRDDLREATRRAAEQRRQHREPLSPFKRLQPGEKQHAKRMATVAAVYTTAPFVRSPEEFLRSLMPRQPGAKPPLVRPRPVAKRVWASLQREPWEVIAEATLEAERQDPEHVKRWVVLVDGAETQLDLVEASAAAYGVDVTVILDIIHVVEYVWKAAHVFHREGSPDAAHWAWTRVQSILEGKARRVAAAMRRAATLAGLSSDTRKPVDTCADYLLKYAPYLHYDRYLAAGYPIATGVIEGACRYLVRDRMELTGARWRLVGAEAVLKLRALRASGDFDAYWDFHEAREYERNHAQRYADGIAPPVVPPVTEPPPSRSSPPPPTGQVALAVPLSEAPWTFLGRRRKRAAPLPDFSMNLRRVTTWRAAIRGLPTTASTISSRARRATRTTRRPVSRSVGRVGRRATTYTNSISQNDPSWSIQSARTTCLPRNWSASSASLQCPTAHEGTSAGAAGSSSTSSASTCATN